MQKIISFTHPIVIAHHASAVGHEEFFGPLGDAFDFHDESDRFGAKTWELAEGELSRICMNLALKKGRLHPKEIDFLFAGDLQNQCVASSQGLASFGIPYIGLYGACSTCAEGILCASVFLECNEKIRYTASVTSSHNCVAERQFRTPIEYGGQRSPTAQWTATAAGAFLLCRKKEEGNGVRIKEVLAGKIVDGGVDDLSNMGAAMAPAAAETILSYFSQSSLTPSDFDCIVTGDLGKEGSEILYELLSSVGLSIREKHLDCGMLLYDFERQDVHAGGSGCGCSASVLSAYFLPRLHCGAYKRILFLSTGALMSPSSVQQGGTIAGIAHLLHLEGTHG